MRRAPAGADLSDVDATAVIELAADGSLSTYDVSVGGGDAGSIDIHTTYESNHRTENAVSEVRHEGRRVHLAGPDQECVDLTAIS